HVAPESFVGGPRGALEDGDHVTIDIPERSLDGALPEEEIEARLDDRERPDPSYAGGVLGKYGAQFGSAADGAVTNPGLER
ncbi:dihydroxy-acid dehydratase, partial [Halolamina salina]|uniref:dihydroxy-acid dehydratase domain-containing protein n=1 Tax=Halolamina salina TaxID=1220023 RepID=UPI00360F0E22